MKKPGDPQKSPATELANELPTPLDRTLITLRECSEQFGLSRRQWWYLVTSGIVPAVKFGSQYCIHRDAAAQYMASNRSTGPKKRSDAKASF